MQSGAGKSSRLLRKLLPPAGSSAPGAGLACGPFVLDPRWQKCWLSPAQEHWQAAVWLLGCPVPRGTQGHLQGSREQVPIVKGLPGMAAPGSPVSGKEMLASGTLLSGLPQPLALLCSPVGRSGSQHSPSELCQAETSHKIQRRCFISCSECASPLSRNTSALTEFSQGFCCVLKLRESPVPARLRAPRGHLSLLGKLWAPPPLPCGSLARGGGSGVPPQPGSTRRAAAAAGRGIPGAAPPSAASTVPALPALSLRNHQPQWGWAVPDHGRGKMLQRSPRCS